LLYIFFQELFLHVYWPNVFVNIDIDSIVIVISFSVQQNCDIELCVKQNTLLFYFLFMYTVEYCLPGCQKTVVYDDNYAVVVFIV